MLLCRGKRETLVNNPGFMFARFEERFCWIINKDVPGIQARIRGKY